MTKKNILITGGAGFIGSHVADALLVRGHHVRVLDNLSPYVHGVGAKRPAYLDRDVDLLVGDIRDRAAVERALDGIDAVYHFAAAIGVGQTAYEVARYASVNNVGTSILVDLLARRPVELLVLASSAVVYGEGLYRDHTGTSREVPSRTLEQLRRCEWELRADGRLLTPLPTPEVTSARPSSIYAHSKCDQERMCLALGRACGTRTVSLRLFNVFGPRQSLIDAYDNPYNGVLSLLATRLLEGRRPLVNEDGEQTRDFVSVHDVARACCLALDSEAARGAVLNIGSGVSTTLADVARRLARIAGRPDLAPEITGRYRVGEPRHSGAAVRRAQHVLGFRAEICLDGGLADLLRSLARHDISTFTDIKESSPPVLSKLEGYHVQ